MEEIWRSIEIEGYEVSNFGRVRSVDRTVKGIITQETKEGKVIGIFDSISTASKVLNYEFASIQRVVNNKQKLSYGYKFRRSYISEINKLKESNLKYLLV